MNESVIIVSSFGLFGLCWFVLFQTEVMGFVLTYYSFVVFFFLMNE